MSVSGSLVEPADGVDLPRAQAGSPPQHLLVTFLADYCLRESAKLPSAALVSLVGEFGVSAMSARAALSRLARRGVVELSRQGRRTYYALSSEASAVLTRGSRRIVSFGVDAERWDGTWTVVAFSMPEDRRDARHLLRSRLRWQGFAPLYDGLWVSPHATSQEAVEAVGELDIPAATVLTVGEVAEGFAGVRRPIEAWDLEVIAELYRSFLAEWTPLMVKLRQGEVTGGAALLARTRMMDTYRRFPGLDPQLPLRLMPPEWPRQQARELFVEAYDWLGPLAETRVRQIVAEHDPQWAAAVSHHTTRDLLGGMSGQRSSSSGADSARADSARADSARADPAREAGSGTPAAGRRRGRPRT